MSVKSYLKRGLRFVLKGVPEVKIYPQVSALVTNDLLAGRYALITGGTSGIGFEMAKAFVEAGATVVITGRSIERVNRACVAINESVKQQGHIFGIEMDNKKISSFPEKLEEVYEKPGCGKLDILVNNAGMRGGHISNATEQEYNDIMDTNVKGPFFLTQLVARYMVDNGVKGNILNIASSSCIRPATSAYHMSKWAMRGLTMGLARSLAPYGIVVNEIAPGPTATPMLGKNEGDKNLSHPRNLLGRYAMPEEIANMAVILVSNMSRTIIGDTIFMSGGGGIITNEDVDFKFGW